MTELYLYQTIHLAHGRPRLTAEHAAVLGRWSEVLFGLPYRPDPRRLEERIAALAAQERYPSGVSGFVRLELLPDGTERLIPAGVSLYTGYALRSILPDAAVVASDLPEPGAPTSAREAATLLSDKLAERAGASLAVVRNSEGLLITASDAPLFGVRGREVLTSAAPCAERDLTIRALHAAGLEMTEEPLAESALPGLDELFFADHRGITALAHCDGYPLLSLAARRIATAMESLFTARS